MNNLIPIIISFIVAAAVLITAIATLQQARNLKKSIQVDSLLKLVDRFGREDYLEYRKKAAISCDANLDTRNPGEEIEDILDFFDEVAFFVRKGTLSKEMAWHEFYHWIRLYYQAAENHIIEIRKKEPAAWEDLCWIYPKLNNLEKRKHPEKFIEKLDRVELKKFLLQEIR